MNLNINDNRNFENPTAETIRSEVATVKREEFAVLLRADEDFVQFYMNDDGSLDVEYRAGDFDKHFAAPRGELTSDDVAAGFCAFIHGTFDDWQRSWSWHKVDFNEDFDGDEGLTHYVLNETEYPRIRVGNETPPSASDEPSPPIAACPKCELPAEHYHNEGCEREECPRCHGVLVECACE